MAGRKTFVYLLLAAVNCYTPAIAATYYVDYVSGDNAADGLTPLTPWRHAVGDPAATLKPAAAKLLPGDIVRFKAGVAYRGSIKGRFSGSAGNPITYTGSGYGTGAAIIEGADPVTSITPCASAAACGNAPAWQKLSLVSFTAPATSFVKLYDNDGVLFESQSPIPTNRFYSDEIAQFAISPVSEKAAIEAGRLRAPELVSVLGGVPSGALQIWTTGNLVVRREVTGIDGDFVLFNPGAITLYGDRPGRYALTGAPRAVGGLGQYAVIAPGRAIVWTRPAGGLVVGNGRYGFNVDGLSHITISGFVFRHQTAATTGAAEGAPITSYGRGAGNLTIENNCFEYASLWDGKGVITIVTMNGVKIHNNSFNRIERGSGIRVGTGSSAIAITNNKFEMIGRTGIALLGAADSVISGNIMTNMLGVHGNGLSLYLNNRGIRVVNNRILASMRPMTIQGDLNTTAPGNHDFVIEQNIFFGSETAVAALSSWGGNVRGVTIRNNVLIAPSGGVMTHPTDTGVAITHNYLPAVLYNKTAGTGWTVADNVIAEPGVRFIANDPVNNAKLCTGASMPPGSTLGGIRC